MKKILLLKFALLICSCGYAQTLQFTKPNPQPNLVEVYAGTFASGDIDGDGDKDLFMTGITPQKTTKLYKNDGTGNFSEVTHPFPISGSGQAFLKDLDGDGDLDLYFSGQTNSSPASRFTHIYGNNGSGVFTQVSNPLLPNILKGAAIDDVDNDGDPDIAITTSSVTNVYLNNGSAVFTPQPNSIFTPVDGVLRFIDVENDGDQDVIISGASSTKLYINNGSGTFSLDSNSILPAISGIDIDVADTDNDGDFDFLICGSDQNILYINNGSGIFTPISTTLQQTSGGQNAIADLDNDGDQDILIVGTQVGGLPNIYNMVYQNTGNNEFVQTQILGGEYIADCVVDDFTGDGLKDIIIQGFVDDTNVYWNTSTTLSAIEQIGSNQEVTFYPNPTNDAVYFNLKDKIESITLYNLLGQEVLSKFTNTKEFSIDISQLSSGTYTAKLNSNGKSQSLKLIKM